jgi:hypothetical protein
MESSRAIETIAIGKRESGHTKFSGALNERFRLRGSSEKAEGARCVKLDIFVILLHGVPWTDDRLQMIGYR